MQQKQKTRRFLGFLVINSVNGPVANLGELKLLVRQDGLNCGKNAFEKKSGAL